MNKSNEGGRSDLYHLLPRLGIHAFVVMYLVAAFLYPGGFDWIHDYWCTLLVQESHGSENLSRPIAVLAMWIACLSILIISWRVPIIWPISKPKLYRLSAVGSSGSASLLHTSWHELMIPCIALFSSYLIVVSLIALFNNKQSGLGWFGAGVVVMMSLNFFIYTTGYMLPALAILQKLNFAIAILWLWMLNEFMQFHKLHTMINSPVN